MSHEKKDLLKFEENLRALEEIVRLLESKNLNLDDSIAHFEKGTKLYKACKNELQIAEQKITLLSESLKEENYSS